MVRAGEAGHADLVLELSDRPFDGPPPDPDDAWAATEHGWQRGRARPGEVSPPGAMRRMPTRSCAGSPAAGDGMVAAATTSLPERAAAGRNYDYRYAWIRDQCYAGSAVAAVGGHPLLDQAVRFVTARLHD